jgi:hypothetical protein
MFARFMRRLGRLIHLRRQSHWERSVAEAVGEARAVLRRMARNQRRLRSHERRLHAIGDALEEDVEEAEQVQRQHLETIEMLKEQLKVNKVTIEGLLSTDKLFTAVQETKIAMQEARRTALTPAEREDYQ